MDGKCQLHGMHAGGAVACSPNGLLPRLGIQKSSLVNMGLKLGSPRLQGASVRVH
jgi:hypothetical protein